MADPARLREGDDGLAAALRAEGADAARLPVRGVQRRLAAAITAQALPTTALGLTLASSKLAPLIVAAVVGVGVGALGHSLWSDARPRSAVATTSPSLSAPVAQAPPVQPPSPARVERPAAVAPPPREPRESASLAAELQLFERGQGALEDGRPAIAVRELRRYLELYPSGRLRTEAVQALVEALGRAGRHEEVLDEVARVAQGEPPSALLGAELEALTELARCDDAKVVAARLAPAADARTQARLAAFQERCRAP